MCHFLLVINCTRGHISHRLWDIAFSRSIVTLFCYPVGQRMAKVHSGKEISPKASTAWVGHTNIKDRQTTDKQQINEFAIANTGTSQSRSGKSTCHGALCGIPSVIPVLLTTKNSDDLEIWVPDGSSMKVAPVNSSYVISYQSLIVPEAVSCIAYEI